MFLVGVVWFAVASLLCAVAPTIGVLNAARAFQGVGGALLTPGSLAIIQATFSGTDRGRAIGAWSGLGGIAGAVAPFLGGWIVEVTTWRWIFGINLPLAAVVVWVSVRHVPESADPTAVKKLDIAGTVLGALGLAGLTYGFTIWTERGTPDALVAGHPGVRRPRAWSRSSSSSPARPLPCCRRSCSGGGRSRAPTPPRC